MCKQDSYQMELINWKYKIISITAKHFKSGNIIVCKSFL